MKNIKIILNENKTFTAENIDEVKILEDEHNATVIEVHFPEDYANYSKRVDFLNIRNEKWTTPLYAPEDERNKYEEGFDKSVFRFTIPSAMAKRGELQIQFIAYLADGSSTIVPFQVILATINKSIIYAIKEGRENPDLIIKAYEYSNEALRISRDAFNKIENAERAALESEKSAKQAENSAISAQNSANYAEEVSNTANSKSDNAVQVANTANSKSDNAVSVSNNANSKSDNAVSVSNLANTKSDNAVETSNKAFETSSQALEIVNIANTKSDAAINTANNADKKAEQAIATSNQAKATSEEALNQVVSKMGTKIFIGENENPEANMNFDSDPQTQITNNLNYSQQTREKANTNENNISKNGAEIQNLKNNTTKIANSVGGFACGSNSTDEEGLNFRGFTLCDKNGKVPVSRLLDAIYPVGSVYLSVNNINPQNLFGGTWEALPEGYALWTTTTDGQGAGTIGAGLPNITGGFTIKNTDIPNSVIIGQDGAFQRWGTGSNARVVYDRSSTKGTEYVYFAASNSNGIYGASSTVQPPAIKLYVWKRIG